MQLLISGEMIDLRKLAQKYHYQEADLEQLGALWQEVNFCMRRSAEDLSKPAVEVFHKDITQKEFQLLPIRQAVLMAMTLGDEVDKRQEIYLENENLTAAYMMECICNEVLLSLYQKLNRQYAAEYGNYIKRYHFIGEQIPLSQMQEVLKLLEQQRITCNAYGVLQPKKSVVFFAELTSDTNEECQGICQYCTRRDCSNKEAEGYHLTYGYQAIFNQRQVRGRVAEHSMESGDFRGIL